jgi:hypothetical protein
MTPLVDPFEWSAWQRAKPLLSGLRLAPFVRGFLTLIIALALFHASRVQAQAPGIIDQPMSQVVMLGNFATFSVNATGAPPLRFQWRLNTLELPGQTNAFLSIPSSQITNGGAYDVAVANSIDAVVSTQAFLFFDPSSVPQVTAPDSFSSRLALGSSPGGLFQASNFGATSEPGEPIHAGQPGGASVWFSWTAPFNGMVTFSAAGSTFDTLLGVYQGNSVNALSPVAGDDDGGGFFTSQVQFYAFSGTTYQVAVDGFAAAQGVFVLGWQLLPQPIPPPFILAQPADTTVPFGATSGFCVQAAGSPLGFQWSHDGAPIPGATNPVLQITNIQDSDVGFYQVRVADLLNNVTNISALVELQLGSVPGVRAQRKLQRLGYGCAPQGNTCHAARPSDAPSCFASVSAGTPGYQTFEGTNTSSIEYASCATITSTGVWLGLTPAQDGILEVDTIGSTIHGTNMDTWVAVFRDGTNPTPAQLVFVACNDSIGPADTSSRVQIAATAGTNYSIMLDGIRDATGIIHVNWLLGQSPVIRTNPASLAAAQGQNAVFSVSVTGTPAPAYQWRFNGANISAATHSSLTLTNVSLANQGSYRVVVTNEFGSVTSATATLTIYVPPTIYWPLSQQGVTNRLGAPLTLLAGFTNGVPAPTYSWLKDQNLLPAQTSTQLFIASLLATDAGSYSAIASNAAGLVTNASATVGVESQLSLAFGWEPSSNVLQFHLQGSALLGWVIQGNTNLNAPAAWVPLYTNRQADGSFVNIDFIEPVYSNSWLYQNRFYRGVQWP